MARPDAQQLKALQALRTNKDVVEFLEAGLEEAKNRLIVLEQPEAVRVTQGRAQAYQELLTHIFK